MKRGTIFKEGRWVRKNLEGSGWHIPRYDRRKGLRKTQNDTQDSW